MNFFKREWVINLQNNDLSGKSASILWEARKAERQNNLIYLTNQLKISKEKTTIMSIKAILLTIPMQ